MEGEIAPEFSLESHRGEITSLTEYHGKKVLLIFSATDCDPCQRFWPEISDFHKEKPMINIIMISRGEEKKTEEMIEENDFHFPVLKWEQEMVEAYKVPGTPFICLVGQTGLIEFCGFADMIDQVQ